MEIIQNAQEINLHYFMKLMVISVVSSDWMRDNLHKRIWLRRRVSPDGFLWLSDPWFRDAACCGGPACQGGGRGGAGAPPRALYVNPVIMLFRSIDRAHARRALPAF